VIRNLVCLVASVALAFSGTATIPAAKAQYSAATDSQIDQAIKIKLAKSKIGADHFKFRVQGGIVYWEGTTNVMQHKGAATRMAKTAGARAVVNHIQISDAAKAKARANLETGRRRAQVKRGDARSDPRTEAARQK
jgi:hypothetical protein